MVLGCEGRCEASVRTRCHSRLRGSETSVLKWLNPSTTLSAVTATKPPRLNYACHFVLASRSMAMNTSAVNNAKVAVNGPSVRNVA